MSINQPRRHENGLLEDEIRWAAHRRKPSAKRTAASSATHNDEQVNACVLTMLDLNDQALAKYRTENSGVSGT